MRHPRLIFEIPAKVKIAAGEFNEQHNKIVDNVGLVGVAKKFQHQLRVLLCDNELEPGRGRINGHHREDAHDVQLVVGTVVMF